MTRDSNANAVKALEYKSLQSFFRKMSMRLIEEKCTKKMIHVKKLKNEKKNELTVPHKTMSPQDNRQ
jgi:hypothetical protein